MSTRNRKKSYLKNIRLHNGLSSQAIADALGLTRTQVWRMENNAENISAKRILELSKIFNVAPQELFRGVTEERATWNLESASIDIPRLKVMASAGSGSIVEDETTVAVIPMPRAFIERLNVPVASLHFITAVGDSMEPTIGNGALLLVSTYMRELSAGIYALTLDDAVLVKRLQVGLGSLTLTSDNKHYDPIVIDNPKDANLNIAGRVVWIGNKV